MKPTFNSAEDYVLYIGGCIDQTGKQIYAKSPIRLARYDDKVVDSFCQQIQHNVGFTPRQYQLALKLITTYERQMRSHAPPVIVPESDAPARLPLRQVDTSKSLYIHEDLLAIKFPYDVKLISLARTQAHDGQGRGWFDARAKTWYFAITESNLNWAMTVAATHKFEVSDELCELFEQLIRVERQGYRIELVRDQAQLRITNAAQGLVGYIDAHLGGFHESNLLTLIDNSAVLGYTVEAGLCEQALADYDAGLRQLMTQRRCRFDRSMHMERVLEYARLTRRLPIYVYDTGLSMDNTSEIVYLNRGVPDDVKPRLLVTYSSLMIGARKQHWVSNAEKFVIIE